MKKRRFVFAAAVFTISALVVPAVSHAEETTAENLQNVEALDAEAQNTEVPEAEPCQTIKTDCFSIQVPESVSQICDIQINRDSSVSFYEKLSHEKFGGGHVGTIAVFESVREYGYIPSYGRGGQITMEDGKTMDVVLIYPSDVQFDMGSQESTDNYGLLRDAFDKRIVPSLQCEGAVYTPQDQLDTSSIYSSVLETLKSDIEEGKDPAGFEEDDFSYLYALVASTESEPLKAVGAQFLDITGDGYDELLIGQPGNPAVYDLYTQLDGEVIHVFSGAERDIYSLAGWGGNPSIKNTASGGADITIITFYSLESVNGELFPQVTFTYDAQGDPEHPFLVSYGEGLDTEPLPEEEWNERQSNFGTEFQPEYIALADL